MFWPFNCFKKKEKEKEKEKEQNQNQNQEILIIKKSKSYLCINSNCKHGSFYSYKEAKIRNFICSECNGQMKLI